MTSLDLILLLARIIQGEGAHLFPDRVERVGIGLAHVALNRQEAWGCGLAEGFHGIQNVAEPEPWAVDLATAVLEGKTQDPTGGSLYVFSGEDVREQGFDISLAEWSVLNGQWELHFFREYPGRERTEVRKRGIRE